MQLSSLNLALTRPNNGVSTPALVGGYALEQAGAGGTIYQGYTLSIADDFLGTTPDFAGPSRPRAKYAGTRRYATNGYNRNGPTVGTVCVDPYWTGWKDSNKGVPVGFNNIRQANSVLTLQARKVAPAEQAHLVQSSPGVTSQVDVSAVFDGMGLGGYYPTAASPVLVEARVRATPVETAAPRGGSPGWWTLSVTPNVSGYNANEVDIIEGYSKADGWTHNSHQWVNGVSTTNTAVPWHTGPNAAVYNDYPAWHTFGALIGPASTLFFCDGLQVGVGDGLDANNSGHALRVLGGMAVIATTQGGVTWTQADWDALGSTDTSGQFLDYDWIRIWRKTGAQHFKPSTSIADVNVSFLGTASVTLPDNATLWGDAAVSTYLRCYPFDVDEPGMTDTTVYTEFPAGVAYNTGTRALSVDFSADTSGRAGRVYVAYHAWKNGATYEPALFCINRGPHWTVSTDINAVSGVAGSQDIYYDADVGQITPKTITAVTTLPTGYSLNTTTGVLSWDGTQTTATTAITFRVTNNLGQTADVSRNLVSAAASRVNWISSYAPANDNVSTSTTITAAALGAAFSTRDIVVGINRRNGTGGAIGGLTAMTIGGVTATKINHYQLDGTDNAWIEYWTARVPTGTTGDIAMTWSSPPSRVTFHVWALDSLASTTPTATIQDNVLTGFTYDGTLAVAAKSAVLAHSHINISTTQVWTGLTKRAQQVSLDNVASASAAGDYFAASNASLAVSCTIGATATPSGISVIALQLT